jgi:hypothetical protein
MKATIQHKIKRAKQKLYIWRKSTFDPTYRTASNTQETSAYLICKRLIEREGTTLLMAPLSGKRYIKMDDGNLFVIISGDSIQIINHVYSYIIPMQPRMIYKILDVFDSKMESIRISMENEITGNIQNSLNQIKNDLTKDVQRNDVFIAREQ